VANVYPLTPDTPVTSLAVPYAVPITTQSVQIVFQDTFLMEPLSVSPTLVKFRIVTCVCKIMFAHSASVDFT
jgi:hypothetical protein